MKFKHKHEKENRPFEFTLLTLVCFESNSVDMFSHFWWLDFGATIHVVNSLQGLKNKWVLSDKEKAILEVEASKAIVQYTGFISLKLPFLIYFKFE